MGYKLISRYLLFIYMLSFLKYWNTYAGIPKFRYFLRLKEGLFMQQIIVEMFTGLICSES